MTEQVNRISRELLREGNYDRIRVGYHFINRMGNERWETSFIVLVIERLAVLLEETEKVVRGKNG